jgi:hypothetical protein
MPAIPPDILERVIEDGVRRCGCTREQCRVVSAQAVTWPDGAMGCPEPGRSYTQALVRGYWVLLEVPGKQLDYRITAQGYFRLCTGPRHSGRLPSDAV